MHVYLGFEKEVSFRTEEALVQSAGESYRERMMICFLRTIDFNIPTSVYISRAYESNQVFVYSQDFLDQKIYLENLVVNVSIVHEPLSFNFDDVE